MIDYLKHIDTISMELSILYFKGFWSKFPLDYVFLSLKIVFIFANSADPDEMHFIWGFYCMPNYLFISTQYETC